MVHYTAAMAPLRHPYGQFLCAHLDAAADIAVRVPQYRRKKPLIYLMQYNLTAMAFALPLRLHRLE